MTLTVLVKIINIRGAVLRYSKRDQKKKQLSHKNIFTFEVVGEIAHLKKWRDEISSSSHAI